MIPEIGHFSLIVATALSFLLAIYPLIGAKINHPGMINSAKPLAIMQFLLMSLSFAVLAYSFATDDFSVGYVATNSNSLLPIQYKISAVWGGHEGSLLLWSLTLAIWTAAVAVFSRGIPKVALARVLSVMGMIAIGFNLFILLTSNPFDRTLPYLPLDGNDLNPLLQDVGLIFHPPMLYMGYVGFSVAFSFAIAALMAGRLDSAWARWSRPWTLVAWVFLTAGIALGSWWAYYELGWGGWWFWDPVENSSFMPWLAGTALIHSLAVSEKRGVFKSWTVLLSIAAFSLSLLGTFLVRSGVLVSVHAFASDPARGLFILAFLIAVVGGSLLLFAVKGSEIKSRGKYGLFSRETFLLVNNVLLIAALLVVLIGTLLPLVHKELGMGSISIGVPFFNNIFFYMIIPFAIALGVAPLLRWKKQEADLRPLFKQLAVIAVASIVLAVALPAIFADKIKIVAVIGFALAFWVIITSALEVYIRATHRHSFASGVVKLGRSHWAMVLGHVGLAMMLIGISATQNYKIEKDLRMLPGDEVVFADYLFEFERIAESNGANYEGYEAVFKVSKNGKFETVLRAEKRNYLAQRGMPMTEAAIDWGITRDLYIALGEQLKDDSWAIRIYYEPFIRFIWWGGLVMAIGGLLAVSDRRYRFVNKRVAKAQ
ncbi:heme lyase CcmF/NrfE family subunit [Moritella sp. 5]|uniref:heme lyase CcmF/NrfE family subunit n=1 Tax=Moritella sp. 5 TaxID=2746231 RepID=UPI001BACA931|nr:heme lyase CcmF/NrfE family subunit [Moritella sp. 5]QUM79774.1 heme lyase CcmF/NrfE family subunit [Moritella sp. 5]